MRLLFGNASSDVNTPVGERGIRTISPSVMTDVPAYTDTNHTQGCGGAALLLLNGQECLTYIHSFPTGVHTYLVHSTHSMITHLRHAQNKVGNHSLSTAPLLYT